MPFLQFPTSHIATSHLSSEIAESSKIVSHLDRELLPAVKAFPDQASLEKGQPFGLADGTDRTRRPLTLETDSKQTIGSEKYRMASIKPTLFGAVNFSMNPLYDSSSGVSSDLVTLRRPVGGLFAIRLYHQEASSRGGGCSHLSRQSEKFLIGQSRKSSSDSRKAEGWNESK